MKAYKRRAVIATVVLLLFGASVPMTWADLDSITCPRLECQDGIKAKIADISEKDRLKEIAFLLVESSKVEAAVQEETIGLLKGVLSMTAVSVALGIGFVWNCVIGCVKEERRARGDSLGWLRWL